MKKLWIVALCLILTLSMAACGGDPATSEPSDGREVSAITDPPAGESTNGGETTTTTQAGNVVDGGLLFGGDDTTTAAPTTTTTATPTKDGETTTTTTAAPTTTTTRESTTTVVQKVVLPAAGHDLETVEKKLGRIVVKSSEVKKEGKTLYARITFANVSKDNGKEWQIPEYSEVRYACYDKNGKELVTGKMPLGPLEYGDTVTCKVELPDGTAELKITGHNLEYWTPWS